MLLLVSKALLLLLLVMASAVFVRSIDVGADTHTRVPGTRFKGYY